MFAGLQRVELQFTILERLRSTVEGDCAGHEIRVKPQRRFRRGRAWRVLRCPRLWLLRGACFGGVRLVLWFFRTEIKTARGLNQIKEHRKQENGESRPNIGGALPGMRIDLLHMRRKFVFLARRSGFYGRRFIAGLIVSGVLRGSGEVESLLIILAALKQYPAALDDRLLHMANRELDIEVVDKSAPD